MVPTVGQLRLISKGTPTNPNMTSIVVALERFGEKTGLDLPHRLAQYIAQLSHESGGYKYDREIASGAAYEGRNDLGNTEPGDGKRFKGRTGIQLTGRFNYRKFTQWIRKNLDANCPDFEKEPNRVNEDPWEGLAPIWFWAVGNRTGKSLNVYADKNDIEMITRIINGGKNGLEDRLDYYTRTCLVFLGYSVAKDKIEDSIKDFQRKHKLEADGIDGPQTRAKFHQVLAKQSKGVISAYDDIKVSASPVVEEKKVAVTPKGVDKPARDNTAVVIAAGSAIGSSPLAEPALNVFGTLTPYIQGLLILVVVAALIYIFWGRQLLASRAKDIKEEVKEDNANGLVT
jgi:putative chitinase